MAKKERNIFVNIALTLGFSLACTPMVAFVGIIIITLAGALDDAITKIQSAGHWWLLLIGAYCISLIGLLYAPTIRKIIKEKKAVVRKNGAVDGLVIYWREQMAKQGRAQPSEKEIELVHALLLERIEVWAQYPNSWHRFFPDEKYSETFFGIVDNFMAQKQPQKDKCEKN